MADLLVAPEGKLYIAPEDLKERYNHPKRGLLRTRAYVKSLNESRKVLIEVLRMDNGTIQFTICGSETRAVLNEVKQDLQGELCAPHSTKKYEQPTKYLPSGYLRPTKVSTETCTEMNTDDQRRLQQSDTNFTTLTIEALEAHDAKHTTGPCQLRQFACPACLKSWWRNVLKSKPVSRCRGGVCGNERYEALPRNQQFGIGRFVCPNSRCKREFFGYCEATDRLACRKCGTNATPYIHPKWRKSNPRSLNPRARSFRPQVKVEDLGPRFESLGIADGDNESSYTPWGVGRGGSGSGSLFLSLSQSSSSSSFDDNSLDGSVSSFHPQQQLQQQQQQQQWQPRRRPRIFNPSRVHVPTGGTISTFLTQMDFEQDCVEVVLDYDADEDETKVGACRFSCLRCNNEYTVVCRLMDTAPCYNCGASNGPLSWAPPREIQSDSNNTHSCSRCNGTSRDCPNLQEARGF